MYNHKQELLEMLGRLQVQAHSLVFSARDTWYKEANTGNGYAGVTNLHMLHNSLYRAEREIQKADCSMSRNWWRVELRDSDGNDCWVYDCLVMADCADSAYDKVYSAIMKDFPDDESDGCEGTFHPCTCECDHGLKLGECEEDECADASDYCDGHGGLLLDEAEGPFETEEEAKASMYHSLIVIED